MDTTQWVVLLIEVGVIAVYALVAVVRLLAGR
jgi:hypothetical protein